MKFSDRYDVVFAESVKKIRVGDKIVYNNETLTISFLRNDKIMKIDWRATDQQSSFKLNDPHIISKVLNIISLVTGYAIKKIPEKPEKNIVIFQACLGNY